MDGFCYRILNTGDPRCWLASFRKGPRRPHLSYAPLRTKLLKWMEASVVIQKVLVWWDSRGTAKRKGWEPHSVDPSLPNPHSMLRVEVRKKKDKAFLSVLPDSINNKSYISDAEKQESWMVKVRRGPPPFPSSTTTQTPTISVTYVVG